MSYCQEKTCLGKSGKRKWASYGVFGKPPQFCKIHKKYNMVDVKHPKCINCTLVRPSYAASNERRPTHCKSCAPSYMIDVVSNMCVKCKKVQPSFSYQENSRPTHCLKCKEIGMLDKRNHKCTKCKIVTASFAFPNESHATHCKVCASPKMVNVKTLKCIKCKVKIPCFGFAHEISATHCKSCAEPSMVDIKNPKCVKCKVTQPCYGYQTNSRPSHCKKCADPQMMDIRNVKCVQCNAMRPTFAKPNSKRPTHCKSCAKSEMVNVVSVKCTKCSRVRPSFATRDNHRPTHCKKCKDSTMTDISSTKCIICKTVRPSFATCITSAATYCKACARPGMIDVMNKKCIHKRYRTNCMECIRDLPIEDQVKKGMCVTCFERLLYGQRLRDARAGKIKQQCYKCDPEKGQRIEHLVVEMLQEQMGRPFDELDQSLGGTACDLPVRRPDTIISAYRDEDEELRTTVIIVEVDEHSHRDQAYTLECESGRLWEITDAIRNLRGQDTTLWILRFNPHVHKSSPTPFEDRVQSLANTVVKLLQSAEERQVGDEVAPNVVFAFYHKGGQRHIDHAKQSGGLNVVEYESVS